MELNTSLEVPEDILLGLRAGNYERIGGVIRDTNTKHIVAWLRDGVAFDNPKTQEFLVSLGRLTSLGQAFYLLNTALSSAALTVMNQKINRLYDELAKLGQEFQAEFQRDRDTDLTTALKLASDALQAKNPATRVRWADQAKSLLYSAFDSLMKDFSRSIEHQRLHLAYQSLITAMHVLTTLLRCYLELDEEGVAKSTISAELPRIESNVVSLVTKYLGDHPIVFLNKDVEDADVFRFIAISERLLQKPLDKILVEDWRKDFWEAASLELVNKHPERQTGQIRERLQSIPAVSKGVDLLGRRAQSPLQRSTDRQGLDIPELLDHAGTLIENYDILQGYEMELRTMRLMGYDFQKWREIYSEESDFALIMPDVPLDISRVS